MKMTRSQAVRNLAVAILMVIAGLLLLVIQSLLVHPAVKYIVAGVIIVIGIAMLSERSKLPGMITLLVGVALILIGRFAGNVASAIGWIVLIAGVVIAIMSFMGIRKTV